MFLEHKTSRLRYLESDGALTGMDLEPGEYELTLGPDGNGDDPEHDLPDLRGKQRR